MEMSKKEFGERIKRLRENSNLTQKELANALGITQSALSKYEKGERLIKLQFIKRLSEYFGVTEDEIIGKKEKAYSLPTHFLNQLNNINLTDDEFNEILSYAKYLKFKRGEK